MAECMAASCDGWAVGVLLRRYSGFLYMMGDDGKMTVESMTKERLKTYISVRWRSRKNGGGEEESEEGESNKAELGKTRNLITKGYGNVPIREEMAVYDRGKRKADSQGI